MGQLAARTDRQGAPCAGLFAELIEASVKPMRSIVLWSLVCVFLMACSAGNGAGSDGGNGASGSGARAGDGDGEGDGDGDLHLGTGANGSETGGSGNGGPTTIEGTIVDDRGGILSLVGSPEVVNFGLTLPDGTTATGLIWSVDDTRIGSITIDGVFTAKGLVGGVVKVTASLGNASITTDFIVNVDLTRNVGNLDQAAQDGLLAAVNTAAPSFKWLYPYSGTVFPRGIEPPLLQLEAPGTDRAMVEISATHFHYVQFSNSLITTEFQIELPDDIWEALSLSALGSEEVSVSVTKSSGGTATETWLFAPASIKGIIFYSTYNSTLNAGQPAIMRVRPGENAAVLQAGCTACHSVSANGGVLAAGVDGFPATGETGLDMWNPENSITLNLDLNGVPSARYTAPEGRRFVFAGLTPDGEMALTHGLPPLVDVAGSEEGKPPYVPHGAQSVAGLPSQLVSTANGQTINAPSLATIVTYAVSPTFSPDGSRIAFINGDTQGAHTLWTAHFDASQSPPLFSNGAQATANLSKVLAWPSFLPDSQAVIYHEGDSYDSAGFQGDFAPVKQLKAELRMVELASGTVKTLNALNGRNASGTSYLPYGEAAENNMNYEASVLPVAVGGYYWVLFTSRRAYGNDIAPGGALAGGDDPFGNWGPQAGTPRKKLWVAAIDVNHDGADPSHPAFYLTGQERISGNMRAFAALEPCRVDGSSCESGADCCGGFCRETSRGPDGTPVLQCVEPPEGECSNIDELCFSADDCCDPEASCINRRCTIPTPVVVR